MHFNVIYPEVKLIVTYIPSLAYLTDIKSAIVLSQFIYATPERGDSISYTHQQLQDMFQFSRMEIRYAIRKLLSMSLIAVADNVGRKASIYTVNFEVLDKLIADMPAKFKHDEMSAKKGIKRGESKTKTQAPSASKSNSSSSNASEPASSDAHSSYSPPSSAIKGSTKENQSQKVEGSNTPKLIISHDDTVELLVEFNTTCQTTHKPTMSNLKICRRALERYSHDTIIAMVKKMASKWHKNSEFEHNLNPTTLLRNNLERYVNAPQKSASINPHNRSSEYYDADLFWDKNPADENARQQTQAWFIENNVHVGYDDDGGSVFF